MKQKLLHWFADEVNATSARLTIRTGNDVAMETIAGTKKLPVINLVILLIRNLHL